MQQQAGIKLDLKENNRKQGDVNQSKKVVADLLQTGKPNTEQAGDGSYRFDPREIVPASTNRNMNQYVVRN
ncbi:hypothetical protein SEET3133_18825 [Salmonella enterica subsp. enterica serovar Tennessee str. 3133]|nr:hypothetical protein SEET3133_18825 [Salmonella enterica subsp. enterica serovar Tennessee str. 3133]